MKRIVAGVLILFLVLSSVAAAATSRPLPLAYNVSTFGGPLRQYTVVAAWGSDTAHDLVAAQKGEVLDCYPDQPSYNQFAAITGANTNSSYFRVIRTAPGQQKVLFQDVRTSASPTYYTMAGTDNNLGIYDLVFSYSGPGAYYGFQCSVLAIGPGSIISGCIIGPVTMSSGGGFWGIYTWATINVVDCYIHDITSLGVGNAGIRSDGGSPIVYNCLIDATSNYGLIYGVGGQSFHAKNTIIRNVGTPVSGAVAATNCLFSTDGGSVLFASDGYDLDPSDTAARDMGLDLSADPSFAFNDDIHGNARPYGSAWDMGPSEWRPAASPPPGPVQTAGRTGPWSLSGWALKAWETGWKR
jgi:hypothetical protein